MAAVTGKVDVTSLPADHWLLAEGGAMATGPMTDEFGWTPTPLKEAMSQYFDYLRSARSQAKKKTKKTTTINNALFKKCTAYCVS